MSEFQPLYRPLSYQAYLDTMASRVRESEMEEDTPYSFVARLKMSPYHAAEFQAELSQVQRLDLGRAAIILTLLNPEDNDTLLALDAMSENGSITPNTDRRLTHPRHETIGTVIGGYLLQHDPHLAIRSREEPHTLIAGATGEYRDTRTSAFERNKIIIGYD